jgi:hypothetical protein
MTWRCSYDDAVKPGERAISNNGPYEIGIGSMTTVAVHEAAHAVVNISMGGRLDNIEVGFDFERADGGGVAAWGKGCCNVKLAESLRTSGAAPSRVPLEWDGRFEHCWRVFLKRAIIMAAGLAAEGKYRAQEGLPHSGVCVTDSRPLDQTARYVWNFCGRDGAAFTRLAWKSACDLMDEPLIWRAISAVEGELFSGLLKLEPMDPRPGDSIKFVLPGEHAEKLMVSAGIILPNFISQHRCA